MQIILSARAVRDLEDLSPEIRRSVIKKLSFLEKQVNPLLFSTPLRHTSLGQGRFRIGDYRAIFDLQDEKIRILRIGHRREIYK